MRSQLRLSQALVMILLSLVSWIGVSAQAAEEIRAVLIVNDGSTSKEFSSVYIIEGLEKFGVSYKAQLSGKGGTISGLSQTIVQIVRFPSTAETLVGDSGSKIVQSAIDEFRSAGKKFEKAKPLVEPFIKELTQQMSLLRDGNVRTGGKWISQAEFNHLQASQNSGMVAKITLNGKDYIGARLMSAKDGVVTLAHDGGIARLPLTSLPEADIITLGRAFKLDFKNAGAAGATTSADGIATVHNEPAKQHESSAAQSARMLPSKNTVEEDSMSETRAKAEKGEAAAQFKLGEIYYTGKVVPQNYEEAVKWYRMAAEQGVSDAQLLLGLIYSQGFGVPQDHVEAVKWYRMAAEQDNAAAQQSMGVHFFLGAGVSKDYEEAVKWYRKAADQDHAEAQFNLGVCYAEGQGVSKDDVEAVKWYRKAAEQGHAEAQGSLSAHYSSGTGVSKDDVEAVKWLLKAAEQGNANTQYLLGAHYTFGEGVSKDDVEAVKWYRKAAEQGNARAQSNLGVCYAEGHGVSKTSVEAVKWFRKAAEQGDARAQCNLGVYYFFGEGVPKDEIEAYKWMNLSAAQGDEEGVKLRSIAENEMSREQIAEAKKLSREWKAKGVK